MGFDLGFERMAHDEEKEFRKRLINGEHLTSLDCYNHLQYIKKYGESSFANRFNVPIVAHPERMPQPEGEIYRDDIECERNKSSMEKDSTHVLKKQLRRKIIVSNK